MPVSPEQMQLATNIQSRMLANIQRGRPSHEGITREELHTALSALRSGRATAAAAATAGRKKAAAAKAAKPAVELGDLFAKLKLAPDSGATPPAGGEAQAGQAPAASPSPAQATPAPAPAAKPLPVLPPKKEG